MRAVIPPNFDDNGGVLGGLVKKRNAVEAGIFLALFAILFFVSLSNIGSILLSALILVIGVIGTVFLAIGIGDESVSQFIFTTIKYRRSREIATLMMPSNEDHD